MLLGALLPSEWPTFPALRSPGPLPGAGPGGGGGAELLAGTAPSGASSHLFGGVSRSARRSRGVWAPHSFRTSDLAASASLPTVDPPQLKRLEADWPRALPQWAPSALGLGTQLCALELSRFILPSFQQAAGVRFWRRVPQPSEGTQNASVFCDGL